jgi:hypothetical protein
VIDMANLKEWFDYFERLPEDKLLKLSKAIKVVESDPMFAKEYRWTGLFDLEKSMRTTIDIKRKHKR